MCEIVFADYLRSLWYFVGEVCKRIYKFKWYGDEYFWFSSDKLFLNPDHTLHCLHNSLP